MKALNKRLKQVLNSTNETVRKCLKEQQLQPVATINKLLVGDIVVNGNRLIQHMHTSANFLRVGHVAEILPNGKVRVVWVEPLYDSGLYNEEREYSRGWIEKVFWYKRPKQEKTMSKSVYVVTSPTAHTWSIRLAGAVYEKGQMIDALATAELVAQQAATEYSGHEFYVCKAQMKVVKNCLSVTRFDD